MSLRHARTGAEALAQSLAEIAIIVTKKTLPDMPANDLLLQVRRLGFKLPFVFLTSLESKGALPRVNHPRTAHLDEPVNSDTLLPVLAELLHASGAARGPKTVNSPHSPHTR
jgi:hypothetical protein